MNAQATGKRAASLDKGDLAILEIVKEAQFDEATIVGSECSESHLDVVRSRDPIHRGDVARRRSAHRTRVTRLPTSP